MMLNFWDNVMSMWVAIGIFHLLILTYQDIRHKQMVDDRHNFFMSGATIMILAVNDNPIWYLFFVVGIIIALTLLFKKLKVFGAADLKTIMWSFTGFAFVSTSYLVLYMFVFAFFYIVYMILSKLINKDRHIVPLYPVFLLAFSICGVWFF